MSFILTLTYTLLVGVLGLGGCAKSTSPTGECDTSLECIGHENGNLCVIYDCRRCRVDQECVDDTYFGPESTCEEGRCMMAEEEPRCPAGQLGCLCAEGDRCDADGQCIEGQCLADEDCEIGTLGCTCDEAETCSDDLVCLGNLCTDCPNDEEGCPCISATCISPLVCYEMLCQNPTSSVDCEGLCVPHQLCLTDLEMNTTCLEECEDNYQWDITSQACLSTLDPCDPGNAQGVSAQCASQNRECISDDGQCGECLGGFVDDAEECRLPRACVDLDCDTQNRVCMDQESEGDTLDATCGACVEGYIEEGSVCIDTTPNCRDNNNYSILDECLGQNRVCQSNATSAQCGPCVEGFLENTTGGCRAVNQGQRCDVIEDCATTEVCINLQTDQEARCLSAPCSDLETWNLQTQACTSCFCSGTGLTGRPWYTTSQDGVCICETEEDFFFSVSLEGRSAKACDQDRDGWLRYEAAKYLESSDIAIRLNARCSLHQIDRFVLRNELDQELEISVRSLSGNATLDLYESDDNDHETKVQDRFITTYGQRHFRASELNSLTKACVNPNHDYNHKNRE